MLCFRTMHSKITLILYHGGHLKRYDNGMMEYLGGDLCIWENFQTGYLTKLILEYLVKRCIRYHNIESIWWFDLDNGKFIELLNDEDIKDMCISAIHHNHEVHVYFTHQISVPKIVAPPSP